MAVGSGQRRAYGSGSLYPHRGSWYAKWYVGTRKVKRKIGPARKRGSREGLTKSRPRREIGWGEKDERESFDLTMPEHDLMGLLQRLQGEAVNVLVESGTQKINGRQLRRTLGNRLLRSARAGRNAVGGPKSRAA